MYDSTGELWKTHAIVGVSKLLAMLGPSTFEEQESRNILAQVRMFDIFGGMLFAQPSVLGSPSWSRVLTEPNQNRDGQSALELILEIMAQISHLGNRYSPPHTSSAE
jgi:hypothetical protein